VIDFEGRERSLGNRLLQRRLYERNGPRSDPCGTPQEMVDDEQMVLVSGQAQQNGDQSIQPLSALFDELRLPDDLALEGEKYGYAETDFVQVRREVARFLFHRQDDGSVLVECGHGHAVVDSGLNVQLDLKTFAYIFCQKQIQRSTCSRKSSAIYP
jgi:hypothetical protein